MKPGLWLALLIAACGPTVSFAPFRSTPALRPVPVNAVEVFVVAPPCPFTELGLVEAYAGYASLEDAMLAMRTNAGQHGANGILIVDRRRRWARNGGTAYSAIAIAQDACRSATN